MKRKRKKVFITWFLSYMFIMLLALIVIGSVYLIMARTISEQLMKINREILIQAKRELRSEIENIKNMAIQITLDQNVMELAFLERDAIYSKVSTVRTIVNSLKRFNAVTPEINNIQIKYRLSELTISPEGIEMSDFQEKNNSVFQIIHFLLPNSEKESAGSITISIDNRYLTDYIEGFEKLAQGIVIITDQVYTNLPDREIKLPDFFSNLPGKDDPYNFPMKIKWKGSHYIIDSIDLFDLKIKLFSIIPLKIFQKPLIIIRRITFSVFALSIIIGLLVSLFFTKRNYRPLKELILLIDHRSQHQKKKRSWNRNEFEYVSDSLHYAYNQKDELTSMIQKNRKEMTNAFFLKLLEKKNTNIRDEGVYGEFYSIEKDIELIQQIRAGNSINAKTIISEIFNIETELEHADIGRVKYLAYNTIGTVIKAVRIPGQCVGIIQDRLLSQSEEIFTKQTLAEIKIKLNEIIEIACLHFDSMKRSHNSELNVKVQDFIDNNIYNINLCQTMIADNFRMNKKYLSRFFKEQNGISINDYINSYRLKQAKYLLSQEVSVYEIAESVGYGHIVTFIRIFKKKEGITPGNYREKLLNVSNG